MLFMSSQITKYWEFALTKCQNEFFKIFQLPLAKILMLHRVGKKNLTNLPVFEDLIIGPEYLEHVILSYLRDGYSFISIDELYKILQKKIIPISNKLIVLTIDDGYKDTFFVTYPILKKHKIPFVFYIASAAPEKTIPLWWDYLNNLVVHNSMIYLNNGKMLSCDSIQKKQAAYIYLSKEILKMGNMIDIQFSQLFNDPISLIIEKYKHLLIDWADIAALSLDPLCTIGAHSSNHYGLKYCPQDILLQDFLENKEKLESITGKQIQHFAYPYGTHFSVGQREHLIAKKAGFLTAVITFSSSIYKYHQNHLFSLPRIQVTEGKG